MERWRVYLESSGFDVWTICERALTLAYMDNPEDFHLHRDKLAQKLFAPEKLDLDVSEEQAPLKTTIKVGRPARGEEKSNSSSDDDDPALHSPSNNFDEVEALTKEMEEETLLKRDVFEIKDTLLDSYKSEREVYDSLQRLQLMQLSFDVLKETEIGKTVNSLRKHSSGRIRGLVKKLVSEWKDTADHWYKSVEDVTAAARAEQGSADSPLDEEEDGLPSPPMDEGALLAGRTASLEMSQFFDFTEEDTSAGSGNPNRHSDVSGSTPVKKANGHADSLLEFSKHKDRQDYVSEKRESDMKKKDRDLVTSSNGHSKRDKDEQLTNGHDSRRSSIEKVERKVQRHEAFEREAQTVVNHRLQASKPLQDSPELNQRLQAAKRKLQENYQQAELAKRQRTIQVMDLQDLPKGGGPKRAKAPQMVRGGKPLAQHRQQAFGRR